MRFRAGYHPRPSRSRPCRRTLPRSKPSKTASNSEPATPWPITPIGGQTLNLSAQRDVAIRGSSLQAGSPGSRRQTHGIGGRASQLRGTSARDCGRALGMPCQSDSYRPCSHRAPLPTGVAGRGSVAGAYFARAEVGRHTEVRSTPGLRWVRALDDSRCEGLSDTCRPSIRRFAARIQRGRPTEIANRPQRPTPEPPRLRDRRRYEMWHPSGVG